MFFRRSYKKKVTADAAFTSEYTTRVNAIKLFVQDESLLNALNELQDTFLYTSVTGEESSKKIRNIIEKRFDDLETIVRNGNYDKDEVMLLIKNINADIITHSSRIAHQ